MGSRSTGAIGQRAEQSAFAYLVNRGLRPVTRNFRCRGGEIDLIMLDKDCLAFVEVRYRASNAFTPASHTVDVHKQRKIIRTAAMFLARNQRFSTLTMRFDVIALEGSKELSIDWIKDAFRPNNSSL